MEMEIVGSVILYFFWVSSSVGRGGGEGVESCIY